MYDLVLLIVASACFFMHLLCENLSLFIRYNLAGLSRHMEGAAIASIFAIASRGFVAIYGLLIAYVIENGVLNGFAYGLVLSSVLLFAAIASYWFSRISVTDYNKIKNRRQFFSGFSIGVVNKKQNGQKKISIGNLLSLFVGIQFISVVIAYGLCFEYVTQRLLIISFVPVVSMLGTLVSVLLIEPKLAKLIDVDCGMASAVSQEYMRARFVSFSFALLILSTLTFIIK